ncbi:baseplate J/gp47 family protein [Rhizobium mayense]|uniref:Baseplate J/gp47 family protein n=1 Tax=Rhizobium mayense TaxID=1312184 RepID=A0ABT7JY15_9HYPH|nr:baseplate J/gp47 family protein [Rhizobium mayense]MDL2401244.1 baseplate J/gp47 family protein [Rhizobium mayense]
MPWPIPTAKTIASNIAGTIEAALIKYNQALNPLAVSRAVRSVKGAFAQIGRAFSLELREAHDHIAWWGLQYFPDTSEDEFVLRHASIWGVEQRGPTSSLGRVTIAGTVNYPLPAGLQMATSDAIVVQTTATATIGAGGTVDVPATAITAGSAGNLEAGVQLATVEPNPDISTITVSSAFVGGTEEETPAELQTAVLARIRQPPHGGASFDYQTWVKDNFSTSAVAIVTDWVGRGSVGVVVVMKDDDGSPRSPTADELTAIGAYLGTSGSQTGVKPVTAFVVPVAGVLRPLTLDIRLRPDTAVTRAAVQDAWTRFVATIGDADDDQNPSPIGARIEPSRISEAISAANGEYAHDMLSPGAPFTLGQTEYPTAGTVTWEAAI